ncbi:hypothetical protein [Candidatus Harpocratesius sp.]
MNSLSKSSSIRMIHPMKTNHKMFVFMLTGSIFGGVYITIKYFLQIAYISPLLLSALFLTAITFLLFGVYYWSNDLTKSQLFLLGSICMLIGSGFLLLFILNKNQIFMDIGIVGIVIGIFALFYFTLLLFSKKIGKESEYEYE